MLRLTNETWLKSTVGKWHFVLLSAAMPETPKGHLRHVASTIKNAGGPPFESHRILITGYFLDTRSWLTTFWSLLTAVSISFLVFLALFTWNFVVVFLTDSILLSRMKAIYFGSVSFSVKLVILSLSTFNIINLAWWSLWIARNGWRLFWDKPFNSSYTNHVSFCASSENAFYCCFESCFEFYRSNTAIFGRHDIDL